jgi:ribosomal protein S18 acetylase RimI-like enzyme
MSAAVSVGVAREDELAAVGDLVADTYVGGGFVAADSPYVAELRAVRRRWLEADLLVARAERGAVVGTVTFCLPQTPWTDVSGPGEAEFRMLAVAPSQQRRGIGGMLVGECLRRGAAAGATAIVISTTPTMTAAHLMYQSMGFVRRPERDWTPRDDVHLWTYWRVIER